MARGSVEAVGKSKKKWRIRLYINTTPDGKQHYFDQTIDGKKSEAEAILAEKLFELNRSGTILKSSKVFFSDFIESWKSNCLIIRVEEKTFISYCEVLKNYIEPSLKKYQLNQITPAIIQSIYNSMLLDKELSPRTIRYTHSILSNALKQAVKWQMIATNPCDYVDLPKKRKKEIKAMTPEEARLFLKTAKSDKYCVLYELLIATGLRPGEAYALRWSDINMEDGILHVRQSLSRPKGGSYYFKAPKTEGSIRSMPIPAGLLKSLKEHKKAQAESILASKQRDYANHNLVFPASNGEPLDHSNVSYQSYKPLLKKAGLKGFRFYDLRHTCATLMLQADIHVKVAAERLGHSTVQLTLDTYMHCLPNMQKEASDKINSIIY